MDAHATAEALLRGDAEQRVALLEALGRKTVAELADPSAPASPVSGARPNGWTAGRRPA